MANSEPVIDQMDAPSKMLKESINEPLTEEQIKNKEDRKTE